MDPVPDYSQVPILLTDAAQKASDEAVQTVFEVHEPEAPLPLAVVVGANDTCDAMAVVVNTMKIDTGVRPLKARTMPSASKTQVVGWYRRRPGIEAVQPVTPAMLDSTTPALTLEHPSETPRDASGVLPVTAEVPSTLPQTLPMDTDPLAPPLSPIPDNPPPPVSDPPVVERPPGTPTLVQELHPGITPSTTTVVETTAPAGGTVESPKVETP